MKWDMRALALTAALAACTPMLPAPRPARTNCSGSAFATGGFATGASTCEYLPADPCHPSSEEYDEARCSEEEARRRENNDRAKWQRITVGLLLVAATAIIVGAVAISQQ